MPTQVITDFFDEMKSRSKGYASMEYSQIGYRPNNLVRLDIKINGEDAPPLATICHRDNAHDLGKALTVKLKELIPRQMFRVPIQACIGVKPVASSAIPPMRKVCVLVRACACVRACVRACARVCTTQHKTKHKTQHTTRNTQHTTHNTPPSSGRAGQVLRGRHLS